MARDSKRNKLIFAHYFTPFPLSLDNEDATHDYYSRHYLRADGENERFASVGGLLRDRPIPRLPIHGDWALQDLRTEIRQAATLGIDGFTVDILALDGPQWARTQSLTRAADAEPTGFSIMLMPDMTASTGTASPEQLARGMAELAASQSVHRLSDGRLVISPYKAEEKPVAWWRNFIEVMRTHHHEEVALLPVFHNPGAHMAAFAKISYGFSEWGSRNPDYVAAASDWASRSRVLGKIWMAPVAVQDYRPAGETYDEAGNTSTLRATWTRAIGDDADLVQLITWNDYAESTSFAPSVSHGWSFLSLSGYFAEIFRQGAPPTITRDAVYLTHRKHDYRLRPTSGHRTATNRGGTRPTNKVEVLTLLTSPARVELRRGADRVTYSAPAGLFVRYFPLELGQVSVRVVRNDVRVVDACSVTEVEASVAVQDLQYYAAMGLGGQNQFCT